MPLNLLFEQPPGKPLVVQHEAEMFRQQPQPRALYHHPQRADVIVETTRDGNDYTCICPRHQWASEPVTRYEDIVECPSCAAETDNGRGRQRYASLQSFQLLEAR